MWKAIRLKRVSRAPSIRRAVTGLEGIGEGPIAAAEGISFLCPVELIRLSIGKHQKALPCLGVTVVFGDDRR